MGNFARQWSAIEGEERIGVLGFGHLEQVLEFADRLDGSAESLGTAHIRVARDLRQAAIELRQLVLWLRSAMGATELDAVISLEAGLQVAEPV